MFNWKIGAVIIVIVLVLVLTGIHFSGGSGSAENESWKTYIDRDFDFQVRYPSTWDFSDELSSDSCCMFISASIVSTSTTANASGTPQETVTAKQPIKLQIGYYFTNIEDPFKAASTTLVSLGGAKFYTGMAADGTEFYLLPRSQTEGVGIAIFSYPETEESYKTTAREIVATIKLVPKIR